MIFVFGRIVPVEESDTVLIAFVAEMCSVAFVPTYTVDGRQMSERVPEPANSSVPSSTSMSPFGP